MGWYRKSKLAFDYFHNSRDFACMINTPDHNDPILNPIENTHQLFQTCTTPSSTISQSDQRTPLLLQFGKEKLSPILFGAKKNYYVDLRRQLSDQFLPVDYMRWTGNNPQAACNMALMGVGLIATICLGNLETIPYTNRSHLILLSHKLEKLFGEAMFNKMKVEKFIGKILPENHPQSVRVRSIATDILNALNRGLSKDNGDLGYALDSPNSDKTTNGLISSLNEDNSNEVEKRRKKGKKKGKKTGIEHMKLFKWEIIVVDGYEVNAFCCPGGKIVVYTGLLTRFKTDDEIATILGHEIAHALGRHCAERITKFLWIVILLLILSQFLPPDLLKKVAEYLLLLPFSRKMEKEADYIGLLLMALAGYDPRVAPDVYKKLDEIGGGRSKMDEYLSSHPSGKKRAMLLARSKVMDEALLFYQDRISRRKIEGFSGVKEDDVSRHPKAFGHAGLKVYPG